MTAREKILKAFEPGGTAHAAAVTSYDCIFIRDNWFALTDVPWWFAYSGDIEKEIGWTRDYSEKSGLEWLNIGRCPSRTERSRRYFDRRSGGVWVVDGDTGEERRLTEPVPGGTNTECAVSTHTDINSLPSTTEEIDTLIPLVPEFERERFLAEGRNDTAAAIGKALDMSLYGSVGSPVWSLYGRLGYEALMIFLAVAPELAAYAARRIFANARQTIRMISALGADAVWIEECLTDQINPELFWQVNLPALQLCTQEIRSCGMKSIYYFCGNPGDRLDAILEAGADAVHFEESKKGFTIDIADIVRFIDGRCTVFGNLDSIGLLPNGDELSLRKEICRQLDAGRRNGGRFVMSTGSPITPETPVERVRLYTDIVRELG